MARQKIRKIIRRLGPNKAEDKRNTRHTSDISTQVNDEKKSNNTSETVTSNPDDNKSGDGSNDDFKSSSQVDVDEKDDDKPISQVDDDENDGKMADPLTTDVDIIDEIEETEVIEEREVIDVSSTEKGHIISEKIVKHYYIPKESKLWWLKLLCCLVIIALLLWILYCLYKGCCNNNYVNHSSHSTTIDGRAIPPRTDNDVVERNTTRTDIRTSQDTSIVDQPIVTGQTQSNEGIAGDVNRTQESVTKSNDQNTMTSNLPVIGEPSKPNKEIKFETFNTPEEVSFDLISIKGETVSYIGIDGKEHEEILEDYEVMSSEVTFREYSYFTNIHEERLPEYRNRSEHDVTMNVNSSYSNTCFDKDCPVVGISVEDINAYIEWLNNKTGDSYRIISEAQWNHLRTKPDLETEVWYAKNSNFRAHGVREKDRNKKGIYGLYGNASELCITNEGYGIKGGSWDSSEHALFFSSRVDVKTKSKTMGFRLVKINKITKDKK